jgi:Protein of unknown function (DUF2612)
MSSFPCNSLGGGSGYGSGGYGTGGYGAGGGGLGPVPYYLSIITSEYQNSSNFLLWLAVPLQIIADMWQCLCSLDAAFDLDSAIGAQLDVLGQLVGVERIVGFQPSAGISPVLDDGTYRILLRAKIAQNQWNGQIPSLYALWAQLFPGGTIALQDNQNMTATIFLTGGFSSIIQDLIVNGYIIPRPETVQYNFVFSTLPVFGFDQDNFYVAGFDKGHFA